ncbi:MAG: hypothetical protein HQL43_14740 [Alphaproteobacteria bacterium]|nr:hypothetical protein [Alphaproteobacteria bacterium]
MWRVAATAVFLGLSGGVAQAGVLDPDHFGTWAPLGQPCSAEPRIVVSRQEIVIHIHGQVQRYGDLDEDRTCASGISRFSIPVITTCIYPWWGRGRYFPFILVFNPEQKRGVMDFELDDGDPNQLPKHYQRFRKCKKGK